MARLNARVLVGLFVLSLVAQSRAEECTQCSTDIVDAMVAARANLKPINDTVADVDRALGSTIATLSANVASAQALAPAYRAQMTTIQGNVVTFVATSPAAIAAADAALTAIVNTLHADVTTAFNTLTTDAGRLTTIMADNNSNLGKLNGPFLAVATGIDDLLSRSGGIHTSATNAANSAGNDLDIAKKAASDAIDAADDLLAAVAKFNTDSVAAVVALETMAAGASINITYFRNHVHESREIVDAAVGVAADTLAGVSAQFDAGVARLDGEIGPAFDDPTADVDAVIAHMAPLDAAKGVLDGKIDALKASVAAGLVGQIASTKDTLQNSFDTKLAAARLALDGITGDTADEADGVLKQLALVSARLEAQMVELMWPDERLPTYTEAITSTSLKLVGNATRVCGRGGDGSALSLNGKDGNFAQMPSTFLTGAQVNGGITVTAWIKQAADNDGYIFARTNALGSTRYFALWSQGTRDTVHFFYLSAAASTGYRQSSLKLAVPLDDNKFHHIAVVVTTFANPYVFLYIDGKLAGRFPSIVAINPGPSGLPLLIGARQPGGAFTFQGIIEDFRVYKQDLTTSAIARLYDSGVSGAGNPFNLLQLNGGSRVTFDEGTQTPFIRITPDVPGVVKNVTSFSVAAWVSQVANDEGYIVAKTDATGNIRPYAVMVSDKTKTIVLYYRSAGVAQSKSVSMPFGGTSSTSDGRAHHIVVTVKGTKAVFYFDAVLLGTRTLDGPIVDAPTYSLYVGSRPNGKAYMLTGTLANAYLFFGDDICKTQVNALYADKPSTA
eukprot:Opistho-1_new@2983